MSNLKPPFTQDVSVRIDRGIRTSGLLARLSPQDLQTLICLLTYADRSGRCVLSGRDIARALDLSDKQGTERLRRVLQLRLHGKPPVVTEGSRRTGSGRFAKSRFRILPLPGLEIGAWKRTSGRWDGGPFSEEARFPLSPGKAVKFSLSPRKPASRNPAAMARGISDNCVVDNNYNKTTQQTGEEGTGGYREDEGRKILELLRSHGVSELTARDMARNYPAERIRRQVEMLPYRDARDPAAMLVKAIREDWDAPSAYTAALWERAKKREKEKAESEEKAGRETRQRHIEEAMSKLPSQEMRDITARARERVKTTLRGALSGHIPQRLVDAQVKKIIGEEYLNKPDGQ